MPDVDDSMAPRHAAKARYLSALSLRIVLVALWSVMTMALVATLAFAASQVATRRVRAELGRHAAATANQLADKLDRDMFARWRDVQIAASLDLFRNPSADPAAQRQLLVKLRDTYPDYAWIGLASPSGRVLASTGRLLEGGDVSARPWFQGALVAPFVGDVHPAKLLAQLLPADPTGDPHRFVDVATPVVATDGRKVGVLGAHLSWSWARGLERSVIADGLADDAALEVFIGDVTGQAILAPRGSEAVRLEQVAAPLRRPDSPRATWQVVDWPDGRRSLTGMARTEGHGAYPGLGWVVLVRHDIALADAPALEVRDQILLWGGTLGLLSVALGWLIMGWVARPLGLLAGAADQIRLGVRTGADGLPQLSSYREAAVLCRSLSALLAESDRHKVNLETLNRSLEERVQTRTAELAAARDRAEAGERAQGLFLATMSHEMRTPLTAVIGMADLLADRTLEPQVQAYVEAIRRAGRQLLSVVNDVLDFMRLGAGRLRLHEDDFALDSVLEEVCSTLRPLAVEKGIALELEAPLDPPPLRGDAVRLRQILFNLVGNAIKFTASGSVWLRCHLVEGREGDIILKCEVRDTGIGIAADQLSRLFQPFSQVDNSATRAFGGSGLGLVISKQLAELMRGRIGCESTPGIGSRFWFEVTFARGRVMTAQIGNAVWAPLPPLRILLAEDAPLNRQLLTDKLGRSGHHVTASENGAEFLDRAGEQRFDLLLVDIQMPVLDGEKAIRALRRREGPNQATPAVALTANVMDEDRRRFIAAGFDTVLHKPIAWEKLFAAMARLTTPRGRVPDEPTASPHEAGSAESASMVDWDFFTAAMDGFPIAAVDDFLERALAAARSTLESLRDTTLSAEAHGQLAHQIKGTTRSFGLVGLGDAAEAVEHAVKSGSDARSALDKFASALDDTKAVLTAARPTWVRRLDAAMASSAGMQEGPVPDRDGTGPRTA